MDIVLPARTSKKRNDCERNPFHWIGITELCWNIFGIMSIWDVFKMIKPMKFDSFAVFLHSLDCLNVFSWNSQAVTVELCLSQWNMAEVTALKSKYIHSKLMLTINHFTLFLYRAALIIPVIHVRPTVALIINYDPGDLDQFTWTTYWCIVSTSDKFAYRLIAPMMSWEMKINCCGGVDGRMPQILTKAAG